MRKLKLGILTLVCLMAFLLAGQSSMKEVQASTKYNLLETMARSVPKKGKWIKNAKGYRYRYTATKKYAKATWLKAGSKIYYVNKSGYRMTGLRKYKNNWYYLDQKGALVTGWQTIDGEKFFFSKKTGVRLKGWNKIGSKRYYFNNLGVLQKDKWIKDEYVGKKGYQVESKRIFVGDSRTNGMRDAVGTEDTFISKSGQGYSWFKSTGLKALKKELKKYPYSVVILNLGVNDLKNINYYLNAYQKLVRDYSNARFYFVSVNPVEETLLEDSGFSTQTRSNEKIEVFNEQIKEAFPTSYIDSYSWLLRHGYVEDIPDGAGTMDGLHYLDEVYEVLYRYIIVRAK